jgi:asparagine synthetase B (glutamine-hydrolysing)
MPLDPDGIDAAFGLKPMGAATCVRGISIDPAPPLSDGPCLPLREALIGAVHALPTAESGACLALSGGVDSALLIALLRAEGLPLPPLVTLRTGFANYDEVDQARQIATTFGADCEIIDVHPDEYDAALPAVIDAVAQPLYNLHPVSRWLLARAVRERGFRALLTGDGADQVFAGSASAIYIPLVDAICRANDIQLASPFFDAAVGRLATVDPRKQGLRDLAVELGVSRDIAFAPKVPRLTPHDAVTVRQQTLTIFLKRLQDK